MEHKQILIRRNIAEQLDSLKIGDESYNSIINRLIQLFEKEINDNTFK